MKITTAHRNQHTSVVVGQKYNRLTVVARRGSNKHGASMWLCTCDCGGTIIAMGGNLLQGNTRSCGCFKLELMRARAYKMHDAVRLPSGRASRNVVLSRYKATAQKRDMSFVLTDSEFDQLTQGDCHYCGALPLAPYGRTSPQSNGAYFCNGIDRLNNTIGYTPDNCVPCCKMCNYAKRHLSVEEFEAWVIRAAAHIESRDCDLGVAEFKK